MGGSTEIPASERKNKDSFKAVEIKNNEKTEALHPEQKFLDSLKAADEKYNNAITALIDDDNATPVDRTLRLLSADTQYKESLAPLVNIADDDPLKGTKEVYYQSIIYYIKDIHEEILKYLIKHDELLYHLSLGPEYYANNHGQYSDPIQERHHLDIKRNALPSILNLFKKSHTYDIEEYNKAVKYFIEHSNLSTEVLLKKAELSTVGENQGVGNINRNTDQATISLYFQKGPNIGDLPLPEKEDVVRIAGKDKDDGLEEGKRQESKSTLSQGQRINTQT